MRLLKTVLVISILIFSPLGGVRGGFCPLSAQSYDSLWKEYNKAKEKDQPQTAVAVLQKVREKAEREKQYVHLLASSFAEMSIIEKTASFETLIQKKAQLRSRDSLLYANDVTAAWIYRVALATVEGVDRWTIIAKILADKEAREIFTRKNAALKYVPFVKKGNDSGFFNNDLLSVAASTLEDYALLPGVYLQQGDRKAACIAAALHFRTRLDRCVGKDDVENLLAQVNLAIEEFGDLQECGKLAMVKSDILANRWMGKKDDNNVVAERYAFINEALKKWSGWKEIDELKNTLSAITCPSYALFSSDIATYKEGNQYLRASRVRNISEMNITLTPIEGCSEKLLDSYTNPSQIARYLKKNKAISITHRFGNHAPYEQFSDSINLGHIPVGTYFVEIKADGKSYGDGKEILSVSNLKVVMIQQSKDKMRYVVVDAVYGRPVPHAKLHLANEISNQERVFTTDENGEYIYKFTEKPTSVRASTDTDNGQQPSIVWTSYNNRAVSKTKTEKLKLFTDRSIYRPGQTVHVSLLDYYVKNGDMTEAQEGVDREISLLNTDRKTVEKKKVTTDEYGVAAVDFILPEGGKNGSWLVQCNGANVNIRVEEYVRPTFDVNIERPEMSYVNGDTIEVKGHAKAYSGAPVSGARVIYSVKRNPLWWFSTRIESVGDLFKTVCNDTITIDNDGSFTMRVPMQLPKSLAYSKLPFFCSMLIEATVTDIAGESHAASLSLPLGNIPTYLSCDLKEKILFDAPVSFKVMRRNNAGVEIDGKVDVIIDGKSMGIYDANKDIALSEKLSSGKHKVEMICESDTIRQDVVIFRKTDERPVIDTRMWWYESGKVFVTNGGDDVYVQFGTSDHDVTAYYTLFSDKKVLESGTLKLDSSLVTRTFEYKKEYGDCICYSVCWVRDGEMYSNVATITRPLPSKKLNLNWQTFRNKLTPGQQEEWKLTVTDGQGAPVKANVMAVLYDKSLDAIKRHDWSFSLSRSIGWVNSAWNITPSEALEWDGSKEYTTLKVPYLQLSKLNDDYLRSFRRLMRVDMTGSVMMSKSMMRDEAASARANKLYSAAMESADVVIGYAPTNGAANDVEAPKAPAAEEEMPIVPARENLSETAFFMPQVRTDRNGVASLSFTLPESVTTWRFLAFAHDMDMRNGMMRDEVIAQKKLMVQPRMPRFLREGDKATIAASVANLSEKDLNVKVMMRFTDEETGKEISSQTKKVTLKAGSTEALCFAIDCEKLGGKMLICTTTAACGDFSDGEQHRLPVLTDKETLVNTFTFATRDGLSTDSIIKALTPKGALNVKSRVEKEDHPELLMLKALPTVKNTCDNAIALVSAYYANTITAMYRHESTDSLKMLMTRLLILQHSDGSWSWWKGMQGSDYVTMYVLKTLLRLNAMVGERRETEQLIRSSFAYLDKRVAKSIADMKKYTKKNETPYLSSLHEDYLYCLTLLPSSPKIRLTETAKENRDYLIKYLVKNTVKDDMATKAMSAIILDDNKKHEDAADFMESIRQHTVYREDMGRYFDSYRARSSWCDYRIPTQVAAIEAFKKVLPDDEKTTWDMQRWLLQSKRTQQWSNPVNTVNAVYAFSEGNTMQFSDKVSSQGWTNVFVSFDQKISDIADSSTGLTVKREISKKDMKVGDRIKVKITITADRDFDFITVTDKRAACLEPVSQLSGFGWGYYKELHDTETKYYFDKFAKGTHVIETEYYVTRTGTYSTGITTVESTYAPEFCGREKGFVINVK